MYILEIFVLIFVATNIYDTGVLSLYINDTSLEDSMINAKRTEYHGIAYGIGGCSKKHEKNMCWFHCYDYSGDWCFTEVNIVLPDGKLGQCSKDADCITSSRECSSQYGTTCRSDSAYGCTNFCPNH